MGVVHLFGQRKPADSQDQSQPDAANSNHSAEVVELVVNAKIAKNVPAKQIYRQMEAMLVNEGVDFGCSKTQGDFKIISYLVQGIFDRQDGQPSCRSVLGETLRFVFEGEPQNANDDLFADLLGQI